MEFRVLSAHVCEDALLHVRSFLVVQLGALASHFASIGHAEAQDCEAQGREVCPGSLQEAFHGVDRSSQDVVR